MQVLVHHGGATCDTDPEAVWQAIESAVATVPLDLDMPSEYPEELDIFVGRFRMLKEDPAARARVRRPAQGGVGSRERRLAAVRADH